MADDISQWLQGFGLGQYARTFADNGINLEALPYLRDEDFERLGVLLGHMRLIQAAIGSLPVKEGAAGPAPAPGLDPRPQHAEAERRQLTVMFCDLVGSTELSRRLDPEDLREVMRRYQDAVAGAITRYEGYVAKFLGDGVLAYFGWPRAHEDQAERAVRAGLDAVAAVTGLKLDDGVALQSRVGIATGQVVVGDLVGEATAEAEAVAGETPNLAARLQGLAARDQVVIGATTRLLVGEAFDLEDLGSRELKGFAEPVRAWRVVCEGELDRHRDSVPMGGGLPLVGRQEELGLLLRAWETSKEGHGQVVLIQGEAGIGKSRLIAALREQLAEQDYVWVAIRFSPYHANSTLYPIIEHLQRVMGWRSEDSAAEKLEKLEVALEGQRLPREEVVPLYAELMSLPLPEGRYAPLKLNAEQQREQTLDATSGWLLETAERTPVLLVWEDLHWADPTTLELLGLYIEQSPTVSMMNILAYRPEFVPPWTLRSHMTPLTLNRLERAEVEALIGYQAKGKTVPPQVIEHIVSKADGVPLYVEELTKSILESDYLQEQADGYTLAGSLSELSIPATLQDSLMARLDRLPQVRELAQLGSVLGREFDYEMLQHLATLEEPALRNGLELLVENELLYQRGRPPRSRYIFKHALIRDAAYQSLLRRTRQTYHGRVAELLETRFPDVVQAQPELVAHHYFEAGQAGRSIAHWYRAGQQAIERSANLEAIAHLTKGREILAEQPAGAERDARELDYCLALGPALMSTRGLAAPEAEEVYLQARHLSQSVNQAALSFQAAWGLWLVYQQRGQIDRAQSATEEVLALAGRQRENLDYLLQAHHAAWTTELFVGHISASRAHILEGAALYDIEKHGGHAFTYGGHDPGVCAKTTASEALCLLGFADQARQSALEGVALAEELDHPFSLAMARYFVAQVHQYRLEAEAVRSEARATIAMCESHGFESFRAQAAVLLGWATATCGDSEAGIAQIRDGLAAWQSTGTGMRRPYFLGLLADALLRSDRIEEGLTVIAEALALVDRSGETRWQAETLRLKGELMGRAGAKLGDVEATYQEALVIARGQEARLLELRAAVSLGRVWRDQGMTDQARQLLGPLYAWFTEGFETPDLVAAKSLLDGVS